MLKTIFILGRQPELGFAELERVDPGLNISKFSENIALSDQKVESSLINRLGGTLKIAQIETIIQMSPWSEIEKKLAETFLDQIVGLPDGKINLGISCYGLPVEASEINRTCLSLKKLIKAKGRSIRVVPNKEPVLSTAQVEHNKLTGKTGVEIIIATNNNEILMANTISSQNIEAYAARDQARPKRDAKVGMLPPKLAQIMINIASPKEGSLVLDPFCGTGVILQEALLMGYAASGTDIDERMVEYSQTNLEWLSDKFEIQTSWDVEQADATNHKWDLDNLSVVSETYLGRPLFNPLPENQLEQLSNEVNDLIKRFLVNLGSQIPVNTSLCIAVPAWKLKQGFKTLPILDHLEEIGYNHISFKTVDTRELIYHRPQQLVARQLLSLKRK
jgi:tRNA G10  N-methylase Trm11